VFLTISSANLQICGQLRVIRFNMLGSINPGKWLNLG